MRLIHVYTYNSKDKSYDNWSYIAELLTRTCRLQTLACLHYNENTMRDQAVTKDGQKRYDVVFPKFKKGGYTVRGIKTRCT
jgi:hypothetical protein